MLGGVIYGLGTGLSLVIGLLVFVRNPRSKVNISYGWTSLALLLYQTFNYVSLVGSRPLWAIRIALLFCALAVASMYYFVNFVLAEKKHNSSFIKAFTVVDVLVAALMLTPWVVTGVVKNPAVSPQTTPLMLLFVLVFVGFLVAICRVLLRAIHRGDYKQQAQSILIGIFPIVVLSPFTGIVAPIVFKRPELLYLNSLYILFFVGMVGYAIVRHRLFDIRLAVARSLAYLSSLAVISVLYGVVIFGIAAFAFNLRLPVWTQVFMSVATGVAALSFSRLKKWFDKQTNRLFYRDAYDAQDLFDELNRLLVSTLVLDKLLHGVSDLLATTLKADFAVIALKATDTAPERVISTKPLPGLAHDEEAARKLTVQYHQSVIVADALEGGPEHETLKRLMHRNDVAALVRLSSDVHKDEEGLGYLLLGEKHSGNPYNAQDVRMLDTVANELIIAIQNALHYEEIQNFNKTLQQQVTDATRKLRRTNERLKTLDETKDDFISMASHQLRTPLTSIKGYLSMVLEGDAGKLNPQQKQMLTQSFASSQRMVYLISDLLNLSRLNTGKFVIESAPVNLADVVQAEIDQLVETAKAREVTLAYHRPDRFPTLMLDDTKTHQVVMNLIDNAIYYTPPGGHIDVSLVETRTAVEYRVKDTGIGVPKAERPHLFTKFYRAQNARKARPDGTGLGLFMAKKVIVAQGGSIIFETVEGKGSTFGFRFPKATHAAPTSATGSE